MADKAGNPSSSSPRKGRPSSGGGFALVPQGKYFGKPPIPLSRPVIVIGSRSNCRVQLRSESVSKAHALLVKSGGTYYIRDLVSRSHVYVDGQRVREHTLRDGELLKIGSFTLKFVAPAGSDATLGTPSNPPPTLPASLVPAAGDMPIPIEGRAVLIGRRPGSDVSVLEASASSSHAVVFEMDGGFYVRDLGSRTGTFVNGVKVHQHSLNAHDVIRVGETNLRYKPSDDSEPATDVDADLNDVEASDRESAENVAVAEREATPAAADDFGLDLLPAGEAAAPSDEADDRPAVDHDLDLPISELPESDKETSGPILSGRRGWRAVVPEKMPLAEQPPFVEEKLPDLAPPPALKAGPQHLDDLDLDLDLPLAPDVTSIPDPVEDAPAANVSGGGMLDLSSLDAEGSSSIPDVDFDESNLVNENAESADVIDFAPDWGQADAEKPLFSAGGTADIAAAERAEAQRREEERQEEEREEEERLEAQRVAAEVHARQLEAEQEAAKRAWAEAERVAAEKAEATRLELEAERIAAEKLDAERLARLAAEKAEADRIEAQRIADEKAEADRVEAERLSAERAKAEQAEAERLAAALAHAQHLEEERFAAEQAEAERIEAERVEAERLAEAKAQADQLEAERIATARAHAEREEADRLAAEQAEAQRLESQRIAAEKAEAQRIEAERLAAEQAQAERLEADRIAAERVEFERVAAEKAESERLAVEKAKAEQIEAERLAAARAHAEREETERAAAEKAEAERVEAERVAAEKVEAERVESQRVEAERLAAEKALAEQIEAERLAAERAHAEREEAERLAVEKAEAERVEAERIAAEKVEAERVEAQRIEDERVAAEKALAEQIEAERLAAARAHAQWLEEERIAAEKAEQDRLEAERIEAARLAVEKAEADRAEAERIAAEKAEFERLESERLAAEKAQAERVEAERLAAARAEAQRLEAERLAAQKAEAERVEAERLEAELAAAMRRIEAERIEAERADTERLIADSLAGLETIAKTEPTPDSAFDFSVGDPHETGSRPSDSPDVAMLPYFDAAITASMSDSSFSQAVEDFTGDVSSMLVEPPAIEDAAETTNEPPSILDPAQSTIAQANLDDLDFFNELIQPTADIAHEAVELPDISQPSLPVDEFTEQEAIEERIDHAAAPPSELNLSKLVAPLGETDLPDAFDPDSLTDDWEPLPTAEHAPPEAVKPASPPSAKPLFPMMETSLGGSFAPWGGNQENYLGGAPVSFKGPAPVPAASKPADRQQPAARLEQPMPPAPEVPNAPALTEAEDEQIESVSAMIDEILVGEARPNFSTPTPFSQAPSPASAAPPVVPQIVSPTRVSPASASSSVVRRPLRRGLADMVQEQQKAAARIDEQIPVFGTPLPDQTQGRRKSDDPEPLDSLAQPPVQETDVFAHTSPASTEAQAGEGDLPFGGDAITPAGRNDLAAASTPMDMVFDETNGSRHLSRRVRGGTRFPPYQPSQPPSQATVGRVDLPNDPFWSGAAGGAGNGHGGIHLPPIAAMADGLAPRGRHAVRPSMPPAAAFRVAKPVRSRMPDFAYAVAEDHSAALAEHKRRLRHIPVLMVLGLVLIAVDVAAIWKLMPPKSTVTARITYEHLGDLSELNRRSIIADQERMLSSRPTRLHAIETLSKMNPEISPGFLEVESDYNAVAQSATWPAQGRDTLLISRAATDADGDIARMKAIGVVMHDDNDHLLDEANRNQGNLTEAQAVIDADVKTNADLTKQCEEARAIAEASPTTAQMARLQADQDALEKAWKASVVARDNAEAELQRLQLVAPAADGTSVPPTAGPAVAADDQLNQLQSQMDAIKAQVEAAKAQRIKQAQQAREVLDASLAQFQQQVSDAKELTKDNPELTAYIAAAQKFQETTRTLVDDLMRRQQQQYAQLTELQGRLNDKMEARRQETWQKDEKLQQMNDQLEYAKRQLNTAIAAGEKKEVDDLNAEIELRQSMIKTREDLIPTDPFYTDAVDQVQKIVDQQQRSMQEDRQTTAKALNDAQAAFAQSQPSVDKLPAEQKALAADMEKRLADINAARAKYSDAAGAVGDDDDAATKKLQDQAASIAVSIDARRKQLADATLKDQQGVSEVKRQKDIEDKKAQIAALTQAETEAEAAYTGKVKDRQVALAAVQTAREAGERTQVLMDKLQSNDQGRQQNEADLKFKLDAVKTSVRPLMITDADIHRIPGVDNRMLYASSSGGSILVITLGMILWTLHAASRELPLNALSPSADDGPEPFLLPALANGATNGSSEATNGHGAEEPLHSLTGSLEEGEDGEEQSDPDSQPADAVANG